jgi:hypothetical protein
MDQHSIILLLALVISILAIYLVAKYNKGEQFRRKCNCSACDAGDWKNCDVSCEIECS